MPESFLDALFKLEGRVAVVTGAGGHICTALADGLARAGCRVVVCDVRLHKAERIAADLAGYGAESLALEVDVRSRESLESANAAVIERWGQVDVLVNGAGINAPTPVLEIPVDEWNDIIAVNLTGTLLACQVFAPGMLDRGTGSIVNISSASSGPPLSKAFTYSVSKAGVRNLTQNLAREWAPRGVRVNALRPGFFPTEWNRENFITPDREASILGHTPMGRYGDPGELVGATLWLASDAAAFVTGAEIAVDGGFSAMTI